MEQSRLETRKSLGVYRRLTDSQITKVQELSKTLTVAQIKGRFSWCSETYLRDIIRQGRQAASAD